MRVLIALVVMGLSTAASADVTVFMSRTGGTDAESGADIPAFGGSDRTWQATVGCVKGNFAPFRVEISDRRPTTGTYITVMVGGRASQLNLNDDTTAGVGPYSGDVIRGATVHVFSQNIGENQLPALCATASHEIGHALGLDHSRHCGDLMSYYNDKCGTERFVDTDAPCGEYEDRACGNGDDTQNSYRRIAALVGLRAQPEPQPQPEDDQPADTSDTADTSDAPDTDTPDTADTSDTPDEQPDEAPAPTQCHHARRAAHAHVHARHRHHRAHRTK